MRNIGRFYNIYILVRLKIMLLSLFCANIKDLDRLTNEFPIQTYPM